jgi:hypothetical protein
MAIMLGAGTLKEGWGFDFMERFPGRTIIKQD